MSGFCDGAVTSRLLNLTLDLAVGKGRKPSKKKGDEALMLSELLGNED